MSRVIEANIKSTQGINYDSENAACSETCKMHLETKYEGTQTVDIKVSSTTVRMNTIRLEGITNFRGERGKIIAILHKIQMEETLGYAEITIY